MQTSNIASALIVSISLFADQCAHGELPASFVVFPTPVGATQTFAAAISGDGSVVVGWTSDSNSNDKGYRWTPAAGANAIQYLASPQLASQASDVSFDGSIVVGTSRPSVGHDVPAIWTAPNSVQLLPDPYPGRFAMSPKVSADGSFFAVWANTYVNDSNLYSFAWSQAQGFTGIASPYPSVTSEAVSSIGNVVVGETGYSFGISDAFRWTPAGGLKLLSTSTDEFRSSEATATNADGSLIVGKYSITGGGAAFRWTQATGMVPFDDLSGTGIMTSPTAMSADGSVIVGRGKFGSQFAVMIWDSNHGTRRLSDVLASRDVDIGSFNLFQPVDISADGTKIVGVGSGPTGGQRAWYVDLAVPEPSTAVLAIGGLLIFAHYCRVRH